MVALALPLAGLVPMVREAPAVYRPRRPERTSFYRLLEQHFAEFSLVHEERYERTDGPLRSVVTRTVDAIARIMPEDPGQRRRAPGS